MGGFGNMGNIMSMFNNPQFMNMATQLMSDPHMQNVMSNMMTNMFGARGGENPAEAETAEAASAEAGAAGLGGFETILSSAQQWASTLNAANPELIQQMRERLNIQPPSSSSGDAQAKKEEPK